MVTLRWMSIASAADVALQLTTRHSGCMFCLTNVWLDAAALPGQMIFLYIFAIEYPAKHINVSLHSLRGWKVFSALHFCKSSDVQTRMQMQRNLMHVAPAVERDDRRHTCVVWMVHRCRCYSVAYYYIHLASVSPVEMHNCVQYIC